MNVDRIWTYPQIFCNFLITVTAGNRLKNLALAFRQCLIFFNSLYRSSGLIRYNTLIFKNLRYATHDIFRRFIFNKQSVNASFIKLFKKRGRRYPRDDDKFGLWRPSLALKKDLQPICAGHAQIQKGAIWLVDFYQLDRFNAVIRRLNDVVTTRHQQGAFHASCGKRVVICNNDRFKRWQNRSRRLLFTPQGQLIRLWAKVKAVLIASVIGACSSAAAAQDSELYMPVHGPLNAEQTRSHLEYYVTPDWTETLLDLKSREADVFSSPKGTAPDFGFTKNKIWLRLQFQNKTSDITRWFLYTHENFLQYYDVYVVRENGNIEHLESHEPLTLFHERSVDFLQLATGLDFLPDEKISIYVSYWSEGSSKVSISFETEASFNQTALNQVSKNFISYGMMLILIVTSGIALLILRLRVFLSYFTYVIVTLLFIMHSDGTTFEFLWPERPRLNSYFSIIIGLAFAIVPYDFARTFLRTKIYHPKIDKLMIAMMIATPILIIPLAIVNPQITKKFLMVLVLVSIFFGASAGFIASLSRFREVRFYLFAWIVGLITASLMNVRHLFGVDISQNVELDSIRVSIVIDAIMMGLGVADRYSQNIKAQQKADKDHVLQARLNLKLNNRLFALEEQHRLAMDLVKTRDIDIRNTVHDIKQPIHALRLNLQFLETTGSFNDGDTADINETFEYLEMLIAEQLQHSIVSCGPDASNLSLRDSNDVHEERIPISDILESIHTMFLSDALEKGLDFRFVQTTQDTNIDAFALMRILSNLVSNAIKYTSSGKILLGVRRRHTGLRIELHDTGIGMTQAEFERAKGRQIRLSAGASKVEGHGYGLDIASRLAEKHGLILRLLDKRMAGTSVFLEIRHKHN